MLDRIRKQLSKEFTADKLANAGPQVTEAATRVASRQYQDFNQEALTQTMPRLLIPEEQFIDMALAELLGMGAIDTLLKDESIEDIAVNGHAVVGCLEGALSDRCGQRHHHFSHVAHGLIPVLSCQYVHFRYL